MGDDELGRTRLAAWVTAMAEENYMRILSNILRFVSDYHYYRTVGHFPKAAWHLASKTLPMR